jgi:hypothetical protein
LRPLRSGAGNRKLSEAGFQTGAMTVGRVFTLTLYSDPAASDPAASPSRSTAAPGRPRAGSSSWSAAPPGRAPHHRTARRRFMHRRSREGESQVDAQLTRVIARQSVEQ